MLALIDLRSTFDRPIRHRTAPGRTAIPNRGPSHQGRRPFPMDTQHDNALAHALAPIFGPVPPSGVIHVVIPHTSRFTVVGNHLAQHAELSLVAIGVAVHIQSLPAGTEVGIKTLTARFPEGEVKIACALRELEAHGYLRRTRVRLTKGPGGHPHGVLQPAGGGAAGWGGARGGPCGAQRRAHSCTGTHPRTGAGADRRTGADRRAGAHSRAGAHARAGAHPCPEARPRTGSTARPGPLTSRTAPTQPRRPLPRPQALTPELRQAASALLADLRRHAEELVLSEEPSRSWCPGWPPGSNGTRPPTRSGAP